MYHPSKIVFQIEKYNLNTSWVELPIPMGENDFSYPLIPV
jgi:hypothetical protein